MTFITGVILARFLQPERLGLYSFVFVYLGFFELIVDLGIRNIVSREVSRDKGKAKVLVGSAMTLRLLASVGVVLMANLIIWKTGHPTDLKWLVSIASIGVLVSFSSLYVTVFEVELRMGVPVVVRVLMAAVKAMAFFAVGLVLNKTWAFVGVSVIISAISALTLGIVSRGSLKPVWAYTPLLWKKLLAESWPLIISAALVMVYLKIDQFMLFTMSGAVSVGHYATAARTVEVFRIIAGPVISSVFPLLSRYQKEEPERMLATYKHAAKAIVVCTVFLVVVTIILDREIIIGLFGSEFAPAVPCLSVLALAQLFNMLHILNNRALIAMDSQRLLVVVTAGVASFNVLMNLWMIPLWGIFGAALATLASYAMLPASMFLFRASRQLACICWKQTVPPLVLGGVVVAEVRLLEELSGIPFWGSALVGVGSLLMLYLGLGVIGKDDLCFLLEACKGEQRNRK